MAECTAAGADQWLPGTAKGGTKAHTGGLYWGQILVCYDYPIVPYLAGNGLNSCIIHVEILWCEILS